jgi:iron complex outermembrane receptor protein
MKQLSSGSRIRATLWTPIAVLALLGNAEAQVQGNQGSTTSGGGSGIPQVALQEVLVTAEKHSERLQDVPVPVTAISGDSLTDNNQLKLVDYYNQVPGLSMSPGIESSQLLSIRGITPGGALSAATVGIMIDEVPFGGTGALNVPDIDPGDLARIEVLRGPQGTLYGASSMGGLVKFVTIDPSTGAFSGRVEAGTSGVRNGKGLGYDFRGSVNVPLDGDLAIRASAYGREDPSYIDNPVLGMRGINEDHAVGGHFSLLWRPTETFSLKLSAIYQQIKGSDTSDVTALPGLGDLQQNYVRGAGPYDRRAQQYSLVGTYKIGNFDLTSVTGYNISSYSDSFDLSSIFGPYVLNGVPGTGFNGFGVSGAPLFENYKASKVTQEIRLNTQLGEKFEWLLGGFYTHESVPQYQAVLATDPTTGIAAGVLSQSPYTATYWEYAAFTDVTYHVTPRFDIQVGGRESYIRSTYTQTYIGYYAPVFLGQPSPYTIPEERYSGNAFTYLLTPRLKLSPDVMLYARFASGYRPGGPNPVNPGVPASFQPDKTYNYEIGAKGDFLRHTLSVDASLYYIDWKNIQLGLVDQQTGQSFAGNAGEAKSQGMELTTVFAPVSGLKLAAWIVWSDAKVTQSFPPGAVLAGTYAVAGNQLPYSSRFSGNLSVDGEFPVASKLTAFLGATESYVGDRMDVFTACATPTPAGICTVPPPRQDLPAYAKTDLRVGVKSDLWTASLYANNIFDRRGLISGGLGNLIPYSFYYIQPRVVGLTISRKF